MASRDEELRAALFRLVDVTPACRSTGDLAAPPGGYLGEVPERPPALDAAMRVAQLPGGRRALGARDRGRRPPHGAPVHRRGVAEEGAGRVPAAVGGRRGQLGGPARGGHGDHARRPTATPPAASTRWTRVAPAAARWPDREALERDSLGALAAGEPVGQGLGADARYMRPEAPEVGRDDAAGRLRPLLRRAKELGAHLHIDMESLDALETTMDLVFELLDEHEFRDGPSTGLVLQAYLRESPQQLEQVLEWVRSSARTTAAHGAAGQGRLLGPRGGGGQPARLGAPVFEVKAESDRNFEELTRAAARRAAGGEGCAWPWPRTTCARWPTRSRTTGPAADRTATWSCRCCAASATTCRRRSSANGLRVRAYCPVGDLVAGMAYLVRRLLENTSNDSFLGEMSAGRRSTSCWRRRERPEPLHQRAAARAAARRPRASR